MTSLVKQLDQKMALAGKYEPGRKLGTYIIFPDSPGLADRLRELAANECLAQVALCIGNVPPAYQVSNEADVTVVIYNPARRGQQSVVANFALRKGQLNDTHADAIAVALSKALPK